MLYTPARAANSFGELLSSSKILPHRDVISWEKKARRQGTAVLPLMFETSRAFKENCPEQFQQLPMASGRIRGGKKGLVPTLPCVKNASPCGMIGTKGPHAIHMTFVLSRPWWVERTQERLLAWHVEASSIS
eukprot:scaffold57080_cov19-Tisochrysis_lutea.AAC.4